MQMKFNRLTLASIALLILVGAGSADAGSVFLKNGYILQGRIVERGDGMVVLGWQNGRVTIHDRFIDEVLLDPSEEEMIRQRKVIEEVEQQRSAVVMEQFDLRTNEVLSLPDSYEAILGSGRIPEFTPQSLDTPDPVSVATNTGPTDVDPTPSDPVTGVETVSRPESFEKIFASLGVALEVPEGWRVDEKENAIRVSNVDAPTREYLTIDLWSGEGIDSETALSVLEETIAMNFPSFLVENEIDRSIGGKSAKTLACSDADRGLASRQQIVATDSGVYVLGLFTALESADESRTALEAMLNSVRFISE